MLVDVSVDGSERFPAHADLVREHVTLPLTVANPASQRVTVFWPGHTAGFYRLLEDPEPVGAGFLRFRMRRPRVDGANTS